MPDKKVDLKPLFSEECYIDNQRVRCDDGLSELKIRLENPNVLTIVDSYSYDIQSFVGEVGGTLGLFLGLSVFSFVEFVEYLLRKMYSF